MTAQAAVRLGRPPSRLLPNLLATSFKASAWRPSPAEGATAPKGGGLSPFFELLEAAGPTPVICPQPAFQRYNTMVIFNEDSPYKREPNTFKEMLGILDADEEQGNGWVRVRMAVRPRHLHKGGVVQGGIIVTLADYALYRAVSTLAAAEGGRLGATVELKVNFIAPAKDGSLVAESRIVHKGNRLVVGDMTVTDNKGQLIAKGLGTYTLFNKRT